MRNTIAALAVLFSSIAASPAYAWGFVGHRLIMTRALELLPPQLKPFFEANKTEIVVRVIDPDLWRNVPWDDDPNHFVDFGMPELGQPPVFDGLPRSYEAALRKFGRPALRRIGMLPWREDEMFGSLERAFGDMGRRAQFSASDVELFSAVASHYMEDAHEPFHASNNYDGQLTGNWGIHARFETDLIVRYGPKLKLTPAAPKPILNARDFAFDALIAANHQVDAILKADTAAVAGKDVYDDDYYEKFFTAVRPILEQQLSGAISATAGVIVGAWEAAGKPTLALQEPRPLQRVRKPTGGGSGW